MPAVRARSPLRGDTPLGSQTIKADESTDADLVAMETEQMEGGLFLTPLEVVDDLKCRGVELWVEGDRIRFRGPQSAMTKELRDRLAENKAAVIAHLREAARHFVRTVALSYSQQALWYLNRAAPDSTAYNLGITLRVRSHVDTDALCKALQALVDRHPVIRVLAANRSKSCAVRSKSRSRSSMLLRSTSRHCGSA
jgi:hypothetical protein